MSARRHALRALAVIAPLCAAAPPARAQSPAPAANAQSPDALLTLAEAAFERGDMPAARGLYERVAAVRTPANRVRAYALYKLAWVHFNESRPADALDAFRECAAEAHQRADVPSNANLLRAMRNDFVTVYAAAYGAARPLVPADAMAEFAQLAGGEADAVAMMARLAGWYRDEARLDPMVATYRHLVATHPADPRANEWRAEIARAGATRNPRPTRRVP